MKVKRKNPPREFKVGVSGITLRDCGTVDLGSDEQVTFVTADGKDYDVVRKDWGFYATPSLNGRLVEFGWRPALIKNKGDKYFVVMVDDEKLHLFKRYCEGEKLLFYWLDDKALKSIERALVSIV